MSYRRYYVTLLGLTGLLIIVLLLSLGLGAVRLSPAEVWTALVSRTPWGQTASRNADRATAVIIWDFRLARTLLAAAVGAALAAAGAAFQGLFRNPLADPFVMGASSGAALGATLAIVLNLTVTWGGFGAVPLAAFLGALVAVALVYFIAESVGGAPPAIALLLAGTALSSLFSAAVSMLTTLSELRVHEVFFWLLGGLGGRSWPHLWAMLPYLALSLIALQVLARPLDVLAFGEETAQSLGLEVRRARLLVVAAASLATAAAVASSGIIGFVGLIAPHAARLLFGPAHQRLLPTSALLGALLLVLADDLARTVVAPLELPVGILTALLGAPFFLYLLRARREALGDQ
jgi:iron complex transport system permease protein